MANKELDLNKIEGFEWDEGNVNKSWNKHKVYYKEAEEIFFDKNLTISQDIKHSKVEDRFQCLGKTNNNRLLFISFTLRRGRIRVVSARPASRKERNKYEKKAKTNSKV